jgi:hypothetical protein
MLEAALFVYIAVFAVSLGYEWQIGPYSADRCENPFIGWACAVAWPIIMPARILGLKA